MGTAFHCSVLVGKNVLISTKGELKLADFGSAKQFQDASAMSEVTKTYNYTPLWTAPEVLTVSLTKLQRGAFFPLTH